MQNFLLILLLLFHTSISTPKIEETYSLKGIINGDYTDYIYLSYADKKDSTKVIDNTFEFNFRVDRPIRAYINLRPNANVSMIYIENNDISIEADYEKLISDSGYLNKLTITDVKGSYSYKIQNEFKDFFQTNMNKENFNTLLYEMLSSFVEINKSHPISGTILGEIALVNPILSKSELIELYAKIDTTNQEPSSLQMFKTGIKNLDKYGEGKQFLKFELPNATGENINMDSFLGKITLVDFWASWCGPCRQKHPELISLKKELENENFDILSVSIDENEKNWLQAIEKDQLTWTNLIDQENKVMNELGIIAIPFNYLIDEDGFVIGVNVSSTVIKKIVAEKAN